MMIQVIKEQKINKYITLKLESLTPITITTLYVNGERFRTCMNLILEIPIKGIKEYNSIDDYVDKYGNKTIMMDPEQEFIGHCSNIQAWVENDYNTEILHRNIAFPLLKKLAEFDPIAKIRYKEEIAYRWQNGNKQVRTFLKLTYLSDLDIEELNSIGIKAKKVIYKNLLFQQKDFKILIAAIDEKGDFILKKRFKNMKKYNINSLNYIYDNKNSKEAIYLKRVINWYADQNDINDFLKNLREIEEMDLSHFEKINIERFKEMFGEKIVFLLEFLDHFANSFKNEKKQILKTKIKECISKMEDKYIHNLDYFAGKYYLQLNYKMKKILTSSGLIYCKNFKVFKQVLFGRFWNALGNKFIKIYINGKMIWEFDEQSIIPVKTRRGFSEYFSNKYGKMIWNELDDYIGSYPIIINLCLRRLCKIIMNDYPIKIKLGERIGEEPI